MEFVKWLLTKFTTRTHFMRFLATIIMGVAMYQAIKTGKIEETWGVLVGAVIGYYYRSPHAEKDDKEED